MDDKKPVFRDYKFTVIVNDENRDIEVISLISQVMDANKEYLVPNQYTAIAKWVYERYSFK